MGRGQEQTMTDETHILAHWQTGHRTPRGFIGRGSLRCILSVPARNGSRQGRPGPDPPRHSAVDRSAPNEPNFSVFGRKTRVGRPKPSQSAPVPPASRLRRPSEAGSPKREARTPRDMRRTGNGKQSQSGPRARQTKPIRAQGRPAGSILPGVWRYGIVQGHVRPHTNALLKREKRP